MKFQADIFGKEMNISLDDTLYFPSLRSNFMSVAKITDCGYDVLFWQNDSLVLNDDGDVKNALAHRILHTKKS